MRFNRNPLRNYLVHAPAALAINRTMEGAILNRQEWKKPILDIGCGDGVFAQVIFRDKVDVGIDPLGYELKRAVTYNKYKELINCFGNNIPKPDGYFNTIFSNSVLEHIPKLDSVLREANRLLSKDGYFYVCVPNNRFATYSVQYQVLKFLGFKKMQRTAVKFFNRFWKHYNEHSTENWRKRFERNGFEVVESFEYGPKKTSLTLDFTVLFAFIPAFNKKLFNKWTLFTWLRRIYTYPVYLYLKRLLRKSIDVKRGGLTFLKLKKSQ